MKITERRSRPRIIPEEKQIPLERAVPKSTKENNKSVGGFYFSRIATIHTIKVRERQRSETRWITTGERSQFGEEPFFFKLLRIKKIKEMRFFCFQRQQEKFLFLLL